MYRLLIACVTACLLVACSQPESPLVLNGSTMGTTWSARIVGEVDEAALQSAIEAELLAVNAAMSTYLPDSEISRFNRAPVGEWFPVSAPMVETTRLAARLFEDSGGKLDVTVGPLVNLWGFGPTPTDDQVAPPADEIAAARARVGMEHVGIRDDALRRRSDIYLDLSSIAKGYGVDRMAAIVEAAGASDYLVEIGGELRGRGVNERGTPWRIAIERPDIGSRAPFETVPLSDMAIATSGDYRNYHEIDGERYSHLIDPTTGRPIRNRVASVTVLAPTCAEADGYATAISIMGADAGLAMAEAKELPVFVIIKGDDGFETRYTTPFETILKVGQP